MTALGAEAFAACMPAGRTCTALDGTEIVVDWPWSTWLEVEEAGAGGRRDMVFKLVVWINPLGRKRAPASMQVHHSKNSIKHLP